MLRSVSVLPSRLVEHHTFWLCGHWNACGPLLAGMQKQERDTAARIAAEVRRARKARGWSQLALAERASVSVNYVSMIERAEQIPSVEVLLRLASTLGTTLAAFVAEPTEETDPWLAETTAILRALPAEARPMMLGILRGAADASKPARSEPSKTRAKRRR